jgi:hypothetical protein
MAGYAAARLNSLPARRLRQALLFTSRNNVYLKIVALREHFGYKYGLYQRADSLACPPITTDGKS